jgi:hypothetical protein
MKQKEKFIVKAKKWNNSENVLFMMEADDSRLVEYPDNYSVVTSGQHFPLIKDKQSNGYISSLFVGTNNKVYRVFSDYSAIETNT